MLLKLYFLERARYREIVNAESTALNQKARPYNAVRAGRENLDRALSGFPA